MIEYRELVTTVARTLDLDTTEAERAAESTLAVLALVLDGDARRHLDDSLPGDLRSGIAPDEPPRPWDDVIFTRAVATVTGSSPEEARLRVQAVLTALAQQDRELVESLGVPEAVRPLLDAPAPGGGLTGPAGHDAQ
ncbi:DUF2267 domain-containing protein [Jiangella aurantiaca]|uniref:DUF2267 domain-containing protein n=1 Tax=Jiangella aurantiaca TaxID=2530373 RepID=A0A4R5A9X9_9ACTN|nr:DUF2267 domain-containing protein [Jiangella aurantiaca]TDD68911.1 DUF2267 domain-containing protein [Jiangella aurantiaca]